MAVSPLERGGRRPGCVAVRDNYSTATHPALRASPLERGKQQ
jgi:hypothetical protein